MAERVAGLQQLIGEHEKSVERAHAAFAKSIGLLLGVIDQQSNALNKATAENACLRKEVAELQAMLAISSNGDLLQEGIRQRDKSSEKAEGEAIHSTEETPNRLGNGIPQRCSDVSGAEEEECASAVTPETSSPECSIRIVPTKPLDHYQPNLELPEMLKEQVARVKSLSLAKATAEMVHSDTHHCEQIESEGNPRRSAAIASCESGSAEQCLPSSLRPKKGRLRTLSSHRLAAPQQRSKPAVPSELAERLEDLKRQELDYEPNVRQQRSAAAALIASRARSLALRSRFRSAATSIHATPEAAAGRLRNEVMREFVNSEASYSYFLEMVVTNFLVPLLERSNTSQPSKGREKPPSLSLRFIRAVFCNIEVIFSLSASFLNDLRTRLAEWPGKPFLIGKLLHDMLGQFGPAYEKYIINYPTAVSVLEKLESKKQFKQWMEFKAEKPIFAKFSLISFLVMPIQRLPRYILLLTELIRFTPEDHIEYVSLLECLNYATKLVRKLDAAKGNSELALRVAQLQQKMTGAPELAVGGRVLITSGEVVLTTPDGVTKRRHLFLFSDMLLWTSGNPSTLMKYRGSFSLTGCSLEYLENTPRQANCFNIRAPHSSRSTAVGSPERDISTGGVVYKIQCGSGEERDNWMREISRAIAVLVTLKAKDYPHVRVRKSEHEQDAKRTRAWLVTARPGGYSETSLIGTARLRSTHHDTEVSSLATRESLAMDEDGSRQKTSEDAPEPGVGETVITEEASCDAVSDEAVEDAEEEDKSATDVPSHDVDDSPFTLRTSVDSIKFDEVIAMAENNLEELLLSQVGSNEMSAAEECAYVQELVGLMQDGDGAWVRRMSFSEIEALVRQHSEEPDPLLERLQEERARKTVYVPHKKVDSVDEREYSRESDEDIDSEKLTLASCPPDRTEKDITVLPDQLSCTDSGDVVSNENDGEYEYGTEQENCLQPSRGSEDEESIFPFEEDSTVCDDSDHDQGTEAGDQCDQDGGVEREEKEEDEEVEEESKEGLVILGDRAVRLPEKDRQRILREAQRASVVLAPKRFGGSWRGRVSIIGTRQSAAAAFAPTRPEVKATDQTVAAARAELERTAPAAMRPFETRSPALPDTSEDVSDSTVELFVGPSSSINCTSDDEEDFELQLLKEELLALEEEMGKAEADRQTSSGPASG